MQSEVISDAMKRVTNLLDQSSFVELDGLSDRGVICGYGTIDLRPVCIFSQDSSIQSGAITEKNCEKICNTIDRAVKVGVPIIGFYDSIGVKITESSGVLVAIERVLKKLASASGVIPEIAVVSGNSVGIATYAVNFSDFVFMIEGKSKMFMTGPQNITSATGQDVSAETIGGAKINSEKSGICHVLCKDESESIKKVKELFGYLPDNNLVDSEIIESDDRNRLCSVDNKDAQNLINEICDNNGFFEIQKEFAKNIIIGFGRIGGRVSGIIANQRKILEGRLNGNVLNKVSEFIYFCDSFNIPIISLVDTSGFVASIEEENSGITKKGAKLLNAYSDADVPKIKVIFGDAFGGAGLVMGALPDITLAWDCSRISVTLPETAVNILYSEEISSAEEPIKYRKKKLNEYLNSGVSPESAEKETFVSKIIKPEETRKYIISSLELFVSKRA